MANLFCLSYFCWETIFPDLIEALHRAGQLDFPEKWVSFLTPICVEFMRTQVLWFVHGEERPYGKITHYACNLDLNQEPPLHPNYFHMHCLLWTDDPIHSSDPEERARACDLVRSGLPLILILFGES